MTTDRINQTITLNDGRRLGYAEFGVADGKPVLHFHGGQSSRLESVSYASAAERQGVRLIAPDRPGFGLSDFRVDRTLADWANDVAELADALDIEQFVVMGLSAGGPYAMICAYLLLDRVTRIGLVSATTPYDVPGKVWKGMWFPIRLIRFLARRAPTLHRLAIQNQAKTLENPQQFIEMMKKRLPAPDVELITKRPEVAQEFIDAGVEGYRNGIQGDLHDWQVYSRDWGFQLADVKQECFIWNGAVDAMVPEPMGHYLAEQIPNSHLKIVPDGAHWSTINNYIDEILETLVAD